MDTRGIILAAGRGSRMGELTTAQPKCLLSLGGRTLLDWQLAAFREAGIHQVALVTGYQAESLADKAPTSFHNPDWAATNMVVSLTHARAWLQQYPCVVCYADIVVTAPMLQKLQAAPGELVITSHQCWRQIWEARFANPLADAETFRVDSNGTLLEIGGRTDDINTIQGQFMGLLYFLPSGWQRAEKYLQTLPEDVRRRLDMTGLLARLIQQGWQIGTVAVDGLWMELDRAEDKILYDAWLAAGDSGIFHCQGTTP
ncbi:MAG: phosphocholine cytidylyltransferase family protein [Magnetococcales bacterium]|nr:phosphocholine cytidylyltransferase family protein [Magnetococcales bacterium]MBF0322038.1 phosphocholine cytidylyltransferase family protein [Magnetococcales bacterium]